MYKHIPDRMTKALDTHLQPSPATPDRLENSTWRMPHTRGDSHSGGLARLHKLKPHRFGVDTFSILGVPISVTTMPDVVALVNSWVRQTTSSRLVTFTNVHMVVEASMRPRFRGVLRRMDLNCPDGYPVFWLTHRERGAEAEKISGPDFMRVFCEQSVAQGHRHFLYGGAPGVAESAAKTMCELYPGIQIAGHYCPPFRPLSEEESEAVIRTINDSGADLVWVCLGCPKQEKWINEVRDRLPGKILLAVGQAVDIFAGRTQRAPEFLSKHGLEWAYRLVKEPRRLWKRYLVTNLLFVLLLARDRLRRNPNIDYDAVVD